MEESSLNPSSELYISPTSSSNQKISNGCTGAHVQKQAELENEYQSAHSNLPTRQYDDDLFGIKMQNGSSWDQPPPYEKNQPSVASYGTATPITNSVMHNFAYDVLLIYDPDTDYYSAQDLLQLLEPQHLKIFDFAKDCPPGASQRQVFAGALDACKYTCIVVTRNFINNFWLKFKADMAIENMMENEHKQYTLVVVVMDMALKSQHLPLDLRTLCPIFQSERYFKNRIAKAFEAAPFPIYQSLMSNRTNETHLSSYRSRSMASQQSEYRSYSDRTPLSPGAGSFNHQFLQDNSLMSSLAHEPFHLEKETGKHHQESLHFSSTRKSYKERRSTLFPSENQNSASDSETNYHSQRQPTLDPFMSAVGSSMKPSSSDSAITRMSERKPQEHAESSHDRTQQYANVPRMESVTRSPASSRQPMESDESMSLRPTRNSSRQRSSLMTSLPPSVNDVSQVPQENTLSETSVDKSSATPTLTAKVDHFSFEAEEAHPSRPSVPAIQPALEETPIKRCESENTSISDSSLDKLSLQISADELPAVFQRSAPDQMSTETREAPVCEERNDSVMNSLRMSYRRLKNKFK